MNAFSRVLSLHDCQLYCPGNDNNVRFTNSVSLIAVSGEVGAGPLGSKWILETGIIQVAVEPLSNSAF